MGSFSLCDWTIRSGILVYGRFAVESAGSRYVNTVGEGVYLIREMKRAASAGARAVVVTAAV